MLQIYNFFLNEKGFEKKNIFISLLDNPSGLDSSWEKVKKAIYPLSIILLPTGRSIDHLTYIIVLPFYLLQLRKIDVQLIEDEQNV